jgi:hypothetical protein
MEVGGEAGIVGEATSPPPQAATSIPIDANAIDGLI